jgi:hypothetical protein
LDYLREFGGIQCAPLVAIMAAALGDHANAQGKLDASYTISFARIRVGDITANVAIGGSEYSISARGHAGGVMKPLVDGEGSFTTRGTIKHGRPVPTTFISEIVSNAETSDVTMVLDEGSVKELAASPPPGWDRVPVTEANRQGIVDPLTAMLFSGAAAGEGLSHEACRHTLPIFDGRQRYDLKLAPPNPKDDKALHTALDLIRGIQTNSAYPPNPKTAVPN